jgi:hypothetical protein
VEFPWSAQFGSSRILNKRHVFLKRLTFSQMFICGTGIKNINCYIVKIVCHTPCLNSEQHREAVETLFKFCLSMTLIRPPYLPLDYFVTQPNVRHKTTNIHSQVHVWLETFPFQFRCNNVSVQNVKLLYHEQNCRQPLPDRKMKNVHSTSAVKSEWSKVLRAMTCDVA